MNDSSPPGRGRTSRRLAAAAVSQALLATRDATLVSYGVLGMWAFTNLEVAYALLRVDERRRAYLVASLSNVVLTVALTVTLVVGFDYGARGYVLGNYAASSLVLFGLWIFALRDRIALPSPPSRCSGAGSCGCWRPTPTTPRTRRCPGSGWGGRCTACSSSS